MSEAPPEGPSTDERVAEGEVLNEEVPQALVPLPRASGLLSPEQVAAEVSQAEVYRERAHASSTLKAYRTDWAHFSVYCAERGARPLPADPLVVRTYLSFCADRLGLKISTLKRRLAAITHYHRQAGLSFDRTDGAFLETWRGIRRTHGVAPEEKAAVVTENVKAMVARLPASMVGMRDRALLLVGFAGGFRRAELCALDVADIVLWNEDGIRILVRQSKTDQESEGLLKDIPHARHPEFCPVDALRDWLGAAEIEAGPLFRPVSKAGRVLPRRLTDQWVARLMKQAMLPVAEAEAERAWMRLSATRRQEHDKAVWIAAAVQRTVKRYAGHSLRAGFVTSAAAAGARVDEIMDHTGHTRVDTLTRYIRNAKEIRTSAAAKLGL